MLSHYLGPQGDLMAALGMDYEVPDIGSLDLSVQSGERIPDIFQIQSERKDPAELHGSQLLESS